MRQESIVVIFITACIKKVLANNSAFPSFVFTKEPFTVTMRPEIALILFAIIAATTFSLIEVSAE